MRIPQKIRHNENTKSIIAVVVVVGIVLGGFLGLTLAFHVWPPMRVVESGSMSLRLNDITGHLENGRLTYTLNEFVLTLEHPFDQTLDTGDIVIIQGVNPKDLNTNYPNSDIIVYQNPNDPTATPIIHRIVAVNDVDGTLYFQTKGDGNGNKWPSPVSPSEYDSANLIYSNSPNGVNQNLVIGRVVMRIPYVGWVNLALNGTTWGVPLIIGVILLLIVLEFAIPLIRKGKDKQTNEGNAGLDRDGKVKPDAIRA